MNPDSGFLLCGYPSDGTSSGAHVAIEWMEYPISLGDEQDEMTITWRDETTDRVPAHDGDGETILQLPRFMTTIFKVENFNCFVGQSGKFFDEYPALFRSKTGVLVLRVSSEESFQNAFICKSRDPAECLLSWINGDIREWIEPKNYPPEGSSDFHWVSVHEVLSFIGLGLLDDIAPIVLDTKEDESNVGETFEDLGLIKVDLAWWYPPSRDGPAFGYPAGLFLPEMYEQEPILEGLDTPSVVVSVSQRLSPDEWERLINGCTPGSLAERILDDIDGLGGRYSLMSEVISGLGDLWLDRWRNLY